VFGDGKNFNFEIFYFICITLTNFRKQIVFLGYLKKFKKCFLFRLKEVASSSPSFLCAGPFDFAFFIFHTLSLGVEYRSSINVLYSLYSSKVKGNFFNKTHYLKKNK